MHDRPLYLDCAATTPVDKRVADLVYHVMTEEYGNAGSRTHIWGAEAKKMVQHAREQIAAVVSADPSEVVFTSGATESNNLAILGMTGFGESEDRRHIISTAIEHKAVLEPLKQMEKRGFEVTLLSPNRSGRVEPDSIAKSLRPDTLLVSVMHVNNETGVIQPIREIAEVLSEHPAYFHTDAAQGFGKRNADLQNQRIDMISCSGHKIFAPKGIGALILRRRNYKLPPVKALMWGGNQESSLRPGTQPTQLIAGFGLASELAQKEEDSRREACEYFRSQLITVLEKKGFQLITDIERTIPNIGAFVHESMDAEALIVSLKDDISISTGAACTSQEYRSSHVYSIMDINIEALSRVTRWSWMHKPNHIYKKEDFKCIKGLFKL